jgi:hypothetical protein
MRCIRDPFGQPVKLCLALLLVKSSPETLTPEVQDTFTQLWQKSLSLHPDLSNIVSSILDPVHLMAYNRCGRVAWNKLEHFLFRLLSAEVIFPLVLETQCLELTRDDFDTVSRVLFHTFIRKTVSNARPVIIENARSVRQLYGRRGGLVEEIWQIWSRARLRGAHGLAGLGPA